MDYKIWIHFIISIPKQLVVRWMKSMVTSLRQNKICILFFRWWQWRVGIRRWRWKHFWCIQWRKWWWINLSCSMMIKDVISIWEKMLCLQKLVSLIFFPFSCILYPFLSKRKKKKLKKKENLIIRENKFLWNIWNDLIRKNLFSRNL